MNTAVSTAADAFNVFDLEAVARSKLPIAHLAYLDTGVEGDMMVRANREGFGKYQIRAHRLVDTTRVDTQVELFGTTWPTPIVLAPVGSQCAFFPEGEIASARAARAKNHLLLLSTVTTSPVEEVIAARGPPVWFQLYPTAKWKITEALLRQAQAAGCPVVALTIDNQVNAGREALARGKKLDPRDCRTCHLPVPGSLFRLKPMFDGLDVSMLSGVITAHLTWDFIRRLRDATSDEDRSEGHSHRGRRHTGTAA
ncbi:MAG: alpha-hydroxy-acid oxidizing protein [Verrucomicrobia bacterium]|nr:alpha-hydroxy-acid oxidizing protein [Verrucomicrobiota bacterium]